ncbi:MAG: hypothetical protein JWR58_4050 [Pseudonocardia sp.]|nr:hypothetical protein [Pseudonocardia sp.]
MLLLSAAPCLLVDMRPPETDRHDLVPKERMLLTARMSQRGVRGAGFDGGYVCADPLELASRTSGEAAV